MNEAVWLALPLALSLVLAAALGFSLHRASICSLRAVIEILVTGRARMLTSFVKVAMWAFAITALAGVAGAAPHDALSVQPSMTILAGGFLFGTGVALNRGCAFSTLRRLGDGDLAMLLTVCGMALGGWVFLEGRHLLPGPHPAAHLVVVPWALHALAAAAWLGCALELRRMWRARDRALDWRERLLAHRYRLSFAAAVIGVSNAVLFAWYGPWAYTGLLQGEAAAGAAAATVATDPRLALLLALLAGVFLSSWQRGSFRLVWRPTPAWAANLAGGVLMGLGGSLSLGGNDILVLHSLPGLAAHAVPAYLAMLAGIAVPVLMMHGRTGAPMGIDCQHDVCRELPPAPWLWQRRRARSMATAHRPASRQSDPGRIPR